MELCKDLMIAAKAGDEEEVRRLIEEGVDVNHQNEVQCTVHLGSLPSEGCKENKYFQLCVHL